MQKRENLINNENEEDINNLIVQIPVMNGFLETLNNISLQEIIFMKSLKPSTIENPIKNINSKKIQKEEKENHNIYNEGSI